jgi:hypothetical protein
MPLCFESVQVTDFVELAFIRILGARNLLGLSGLRHYRVSPFIR